MPKSLFDPREAPIESVGGEAPLLIDRLAPDALRARFAHPPRWTQETDDAQLLRSTIPSMTPAAVLIPLIQRESGMTLLLTQRAAHLTDHAGQISFPGGRLEQSDASSVEAALRETQEEVGLHPRHVDVLGTLPDYLTITGYRITPVVSIVSPPFELAPDLSEVAEIFEVPLLFLMDGKNHQRRTVKLPGELGVRSFYAMPYDRYLIWGATAGMLRNLFHFLRA